MLKQTIQKANKLYGLDIKCHLRCSEDVVVASTLVNGDGTYTISFNPKVFEQYPNQMKANMPPHEVAHIVQHLLEGKLSHDANFCRYMELLKK